MDDSSLRVGFVTDGTMSDEQRAALDWLRGRRFDAESVAFDEVTAGRFDVLWWHRRGPVPSNGPPSEVASRVQQFLRSGGGLLLTLRAMRAVDALDVDPVPPDVTGVDSVTQPTGVLWRSLYDDHPAVAGADSLRLPVCDRGAVPVARYENVLPARGEVLASTVRGGQAVPREMTVVSWNAGRGAVLGVGAPLSFEQPVPEDLAATRTRLTVDCLNAVASGREQPDRPKEAAQFREMRERVPDDGIRPAYHFTPPANWLNDPNGLIRWNDRYHLFYQYNPAGPFHNTIHWGHAVSDDLIRWTDEPVALSPSPDGPDRDGCWSGCAVDDDGTPTILYTGGNGRSQLPCLATTDDPNLCRWVKHEDNPVIEEPPSDLDVVETDHWNAEFRDHSVWREDGVWHQVIGSGVTDSGGAALLYTSDDLREWRYEGPLLVGDGPPGTVWECPELLDLGDKQLLHVSDHEDVRYFLGEIRDGEFDVERRGLLDHGDFYAPQSMRDGDRHLTWGWLPEARDLDAQWDAGWSGALSLPRVLTTGSDGRLRQRPAEEVTGLREHRFPVAESLALAADGRHTLDASGRALELRLEVALGDASAFELSVLESPDRTERTLVRYTRGGEVVLDRTAASADHRAAADTHRMDVPPHDEPLSLRVFVDGSVLELYANERHCLTSRVYPTREDSTGVSLAAEDGRVTADSLACWALGSALTEGGDARWACSPQL